LNISGGYTLNLVPGIGAPRIDPGGFMEYTIYDVGDGVCLEAGDVDSLIIDFGSQQKEEIKWDNIMQSPYCPSQLLISHYHTDHYNGLSQLKNRSIHIQKLYYPKIPNFEYKEEYLKFYYLYSKISGETSGSPALDFQELVKQKNISTSVLNSRPVKRGDIIETPGKDFEVIWPPEELQGNTLRALKNHIRNIHGIIEKSPYLSKIWRLFEGLHIGNEKDTLDFGNNGDKIDNFITDLNKTEEDNGQITVLSGELRKITNRFSVCLYRPDDFLFLGDLEPAEINACIKYLKEEHQSIHVNCLIAPHHGTHWSRILFDIYANLVIVCNGIEMNKNFKNEFKKVGKHCLPTYYMGDINLYSNTDCNIHAFRLPEHLNIL
jgi:beta-lactamase superfamily II metal-dependent hydrolase